MRSNGLGLSRATIELGLKPVYQGPQAAMMLGDPVGGFGSWVDFIRRQGVEIEDESVAVQWASGGDLRSAYDWLRERVGHYGTRFDCYECCGHCATATRSGQRQGQPSRPPQIIGQLAGVASL